MDDPGGIFITGASGLLGRSLVEKFTDEGWFVFAHYYRKKGASCGSCEWLKGDFSTLERTRDFIKRNISKLKVCSALINNYGPITYKDTGDLKSEDLISDFHNNLVVPNEIISSLAGSGPLNSVVNIAYEGVGEIKPYSKILPYAIAKSGLQMLTLSYGREFKDIEFSLVSPPPLKGGEYGKSTGEVEKPEMIAEKIFKIIKKGSDV